MGCPRQYKRHKLKAVRISFDLHQPDDNGERKSLIIFNLKQGSGFTFLDKNKVSKKVIDHMEKGTYPDAC